MARPREFDIDEALEAAMDTFWSQGYEATSMADLMAAMKLQKGSIYKAFRDKHDLFMQALGRYLDNILIMMRQAIGEGATPREGLRCWLKNNVMQLCCGQEMQRGCLAMNSMVELGSHDKEVVDRLKQSRERLKRLLTQTIEHGQALGEFRKDRSASDLAEVLLIFSVGLVSSSKGVVDPSATEQAADFALSMLE